LTAPDNIAAAYRISGNTVRHPVQQIFGYMKINNLKYDILTNYEKFYFLKREKLLLHISSAIKSSDVDASVYRALHYIIYLSIEDHLCRPNTSINDDKNYDSDDDEIEEEKDNENNDNDDVYLPKQQQQQSSNEKHQSSKSKKIKLMNEVLGYGQNGCVYKSLYNNKEYATKICDTIKSKQMIIQLKNESELYKHLKLLQGVYIPSRIVSGYLKNLNWFYIVCYEIGGTTKKFDEYTNHEKLMALETLNHLHQQNVLHNDLRFENFLINNDNHPH
jgi:hypothetical protein